MDWEQESHTALAAQRYRKIQGWVLNWRLTAAAGVIILALATPSLRTVPALRTMLLAGCAASYAVIHYMAATRTRAGNSRRLQAVDITAVVTLMLISAGDLKWIFIMAMYSISALIERPASRAPAIMGFSTILSLAYLVSQWLTGIPPTQVLTAPHELGVFALFYFYGLGFSGFSAVLGRLSVLELDAQLDELRKSYRRRLHDDLGNTLCGLHFKIQTLARLPKAGMGDALVFLARGYKRANSVLNNIVSGLHAQLDDDLLVSLESLVHRIEEETGLNVQFSAPDLRLAFSAEIQREILAVIYEAAMNSFKHSGSRQVSIEAQRIGKEIQFSVSDRGTGFDLALLEKKAAAGSKGTMGMHERAQLIGASLQILGEAGRGTTVLLTTPLPADHAISRAPSGWLPDFFSGDKQSKRLYLIVVLAKPAVALLILIQGAITLAGGHPSPVALSVAVALVMVNSIVWSGFRYRIFNLIRKNPLIMLVDFFFMAGIMFVTLSFDLPSYITSFPYVSFIISGIVLGSRTNAWLVAASAPALLPLYVFPFLALEPRSLILRIEDFLQFAVGAVYCALMVGFAGDYIRKLEQEQENAVNRELQRQQEKMAAIAHGRLSSLVDRLSGYVQELMNGSGGEINLPQISELESRSREVKARLRSMLNSLSDA